MEMDKDDENFEDFKECLEKLLKLQLLESPADGIAKLIIDNGTNILSIKQKNVYNNFIWPHFGDLICVRDWCNESIPWCEMPAIIEDDEKICAICRLLEENELKDLRHH